MSIGPAAAQYPEHYRKDHAAQRAAANVVVVEEGTMRVILRKALAVLPDGWRVIIFADRAILYKKPATYQYALESFTA